MKIDAYEKIKLILDRHSVIAWDADDTLINGPHSELFSRYVLENPSKEHHIVTFRHGKWAQELWDEIQAYDMNKDHFSALHHLPHDGYYWCHNTKETMLEDKWQEQADCWGIPLEQLIDWGDRFVNYKGSKAAEIGASILIDDKPQWVIKDCMNNNVHFLNAITLEFTAHG